MSQIRMGLMTERGNTLDELKTRWTKTITEKDKAQACTEQELLIIHNPVADKFKSSYKTLIKKQKKINSPSQYL